MKKTINILKKHFVSVVLFNIAFILAYFNIGLIATIILTIFIYTIGWIFICSEYKLLRKLQLEISESKKSHTEIEDFIKKSRINGKKTDIFLKNLKK